MERDGQSVCMAAETVLYLVAALQISSVAHLASFDFDRGLIGMYEEVVSNMYLICLRRFAVFRGAPPDQKEKNKQANASDPPLIRWIDSIL